ncbi:uncharacterized protein LOC143041748 [Oratosquilla oratoria]|uniref:uncharacterized protein LOC143041748 n=1 Tax=Oratosquilla oratoria TaxID=337810 RepID=UPI003F7721CD
MKILVLLVLCLSGALARPKDIINFELDHMEHEQEGQAGRAVEGEYSWVAPDGEKYVVQYVADHLGYRVVDSNAVPEVLEVDPVENEIVEIIVPDVESPLVRAAVLEEPVELVEEEPLVLEEEGVEKARIVASKVVEPEVVPAVEIVGEEKAAEVVNTEILFPEDTAASPNPEGVKKPGPEPPVVAPIAASAKVDAQGEDDLAQNSPSLARVGEEEEEEEEEGEEEEEEVEEESPEIRALEIEEGDEDGDEKGNIEDALPKSSDLYTEELEDEDDK